MEPFIGQIQAFGCNFAPRNWAFCNGQLLPINQYTALFSLLGTQYGGDGRTTFGLPDLRGRAAIHQGHGPGLSPYTMGQKGGSETTTLTAANLPNIPMRVSSANATKSTATQGSSIATPGSGDGRGFAATEGFNDATPDIALNPAVAGGNSAAFSNVQPFQGVNYCIALEGLFPSRS